MNSIMSGGSCSPCILQKQRESSKLAIEEIPLFLEGKDYTEMKRKLRKDAFASHAYCTCRLFARQTYNNRYVYNVGNRMLQDLQCIKDCDLYYLERAETFERASLKSLQYMKAVNKHCVLDLEERTTMRELVYSWFTH